MNNKILLPLFILVISAIIYSCDKQVSVSGPQIYEIGKSKIYISTSPKGAIVFVDDKNLGITTPDTVKWLTEGSHKFTLKLDPFLDYSFEAETVEAAVMNFEYNFYTDAKNFGSIYFNSTPKNCDIYLNDSLLGFKTPYTQINLIPAQYKVKYSFPEHRSDSLFVFVYAGKQAFVNMTLADTTIWVNYNTENSFIPDNTIKDILVDNENNIWVATWHNGIMVKRNGIWESLNTDNSNLPGNIIHKIKQDHANNIWVATYTGIAKITNSNISKYTTDNSGLPHNFVTDIDFDLRGNIWIGTQNGLSKFDGNSKWENFNTSNSGIPANFISAVLIDKTDSLWIGTNEFSMAKFHSINETWTIYETGLGSIGDPIKALTVDMSNKIWVGLEANPRSGKLGGVFVLENEKLVEIEFGLSNKFINSFYLDDNNTMWIGTRSGLLSVKSKEDFKIYKASYSSLPINDILSVSKDQNNNLWIGTNGRGLVKYKIWKE